MSKAMEVVVGAERTPGVYRVAGLSPSDVLDVARTWRWESWYLNVAHVDTKQEFLSAIGRAMDFPAYFGKNWDALEECLRDLPKAEGYILLIDNPAEFARAAPREWETALSILQSVSDFWLAEGTPFYALLAHTRGAAPGVPLLD